MTGCFPEIPSWVRMWLLAIAIFFGAKWFAWHHASKKILGAKRPLHFFEFMFLWVGMEAEVFMKPAVPSRPPVAKEWVFGFAKTIFGVILCWGIARRFFPQFPMVAGWLGLFGLVFILHFGTFHLLALAWQSFGVPVKPIMRAPILSRSLAEFWGLRWNRAFNQLVFDFIFRPFKRTLGLAGVTMVVFLVSGIMHDLVISWPAGGGYGMPTLYFLIQGAGLLFERSRFGRVLGLGKNWSGWIFVVIVTVGPIGLLFHRMFVMNVILPMLKYLGAI